MWRDAKGGPALPNFDGLTAEQALRRAIADDYAGRVALVSSFGAEAAALLALVAEIDPATPVLFVETEMLFPETLAYQRDLAGRLGLTDVRIVRPDAEERAAEDPKGQLHRRDPDACCALRKVRPLERALEGFDAWISGRKRAQIAMRAAVAPVERDPAGRVKINPLFDWTAEDVRDFIAARGLPAHPLVARGYASIGCAPCTTPVRPGEDPRAGRWRGRDKTECGIHLDASGRMTRFVPARIVVTRDGAEPEAEGDGAGLVLPLDARPEADAALLGAGRIAIAKGGFSDGRAFSLAARLRALGYAGVIRVEGPALPDQRAHYFACGVDEIALEPGHFARTGRDAWERPLPPPPFRRRRAAA